MKDKLIEALTTERNLFSSRGQDTTEHDVAIEYLKTGKLPTDYIEYEFELLDAAIHDIETLYSDYSCI